MTDLQDAICDRLAGAKVSRDWANGPLHVAATVIVPGFELADNMHGRRQGQLVRTMGWPRLFCYAVNGGNVTLTREEDRRSLAIHLCQQVAPRKKQLRLPTRRKCEVACWAAIHAHPLACSTDCPLHKAVAALAEDYLAGRQTTKTQLQTA